MPSIFWLRAKIPNSILRQKLPVKGIKKQELGFLELGGKYSFKNDRIWFSMGLEETTSQYWIKSEFLSLELMSTAPP